MTAQKTPDEIADQVNADMDAWIEEQRKNGVWPRLASTEGQKYYAQLVAQALCDAREAAIDECAEHLSQRADKTTEGDLRRWFDYCAAEIRALKKGKV